MSVKYRIGILLIGTIRFIIGKNMMALKYIYKNFWSFMALLSCVAFVGCVHLLEIDDEDSQSAVVEIGDFEMQSSEVITRAREGYHDFNASTDLPTDPVIIGYTQKLPAGSNEIMWSTATYDSESSKWKSNIRVKKYYEEMEVMHNVFAILTGRDVYNKISTSLTDASEPVLTISSVPAICASNIMVSSGASLQAAGGNTLAKGSYSAHLARDAGDSKNHQMNFIMDNIMCGLNVKFNIGTTYNDLRDIILKSVTISSSDENTGKYEVVVKFTNTDTGAQVTGMTAQGSSKIEYTVSKDTDDYIITDSDHSVLGGKGYKGMILTTAAQPFMSCYMVPELANSKTKLQNLTMTVTYDVFDKTGFRTRKDQTATNKLGNVLLDGENSLVKANNMINLTVTVAPTYLYQLSDADLDNPGLTITKNN